MSKHVICIYAILSSSRETVIVLHYFFFQLMTRTLNLLHVITNQYIERINFYFYEHNVHVREKTTKDEDITGQCLLF